MSFANWTMRNKQLWAALDYAQAHNSEWLAGFEALLRFPSISQDHAFQPQLLACADWIVAEMRRIGLENARALPTAGNPIVYADWLGAGESQPTILIYAHYDVQPVGDESRWQTPPFEPTIVEGRLVARGAVDDKCGIWINLKAIEAALAACGQLPVNIKLMFEGEEELGSRNAPDFIAANRELLQADALIICDGPFSPGQPIIGNGVRGAISCQLRVMGPPHDLHSGRYGGAVKNPAHHLARIIASFHDDAGRVQIAGFYDDAIPMSDKQRRDLNRLWKTIGPEIQRAAGVNAFFGDYLGVFAERTTAQPTLDVSAITSGWQGEGARNIIPAEASCTLTVRTVAGQDSDRMWARLIDHVSGFTTPGISIDFDQLSVAHPFLMPDDSAQMRAIQRALKATLGREALLMRHGGSLAIGGVFQRELGLAVSMLGYGSGGNSHAPNEYITLADIPLATEAAIRLLFELGG